MHFMVKIIVHPRALSVELWKIFIKLDQFWIEKDENIVTVVVLKSILTWFVRVLLRTVKCPFLDVHNNWDLVKRQRGVLCGWIKL